MCQEVTRADVSDGLPLYRSNSIMRDDDLLDLVMWPFGLYDFYSNVLNDVTQDTRFGYVIAMH